MKVVLYSSYYDEPSSFQNLIWEEVVRTVSSYRIRDLGSFCDDEYQQVDSIGK